MKNTNEKIKRCLTCPVAHKFISEYLLFCEAYKEFKKSRGKYKEHLKRSIDKISETLHIEGTYQERLKFLVNLSTPNFEVDKYYPELNQISECIKTLHSLIYPLKIFFFKSDYPEEVVIDLKKMNINRLCCVNDVLKKNKIETATITNEEKKWSDTYLKSLGYTLSNDEYEDDPTDEEIEKAVDTYNKFRSIIIDYCTNAIGKISYEYCNPFFGEYSSLKNCSEVYINSNSLLGLRIFRLKDEYRSIVYNYLEKAPKKFNKILSRVIKYQNLKYSDVAELMNNKIDDNINVIRKKANSIKSYIENENNKLSDKEKEKLQKILLVSDELLKCGMGEVYGNWNDVLKNQSDPAEKTTLFKHYQTKNYTSTKPKILDDIRELINDDSRFEEAKTSSPFFDKKYVCLYATEDNYSGDIAYNYEAMYEELLNPEDFNTLLSVLEESQAHEQE